MILANTSNTYSGNTTVNAGTLKLGAAGAVPSGSNLTVGGGAIFDLAGNSQTVANIAMADGSISNSGAATALSLGGNTGTVSYTGVCAGGVISVNTLNLASGTAASAAHTFTVADGEAAADLTVSSIIADGSTFSQSLVKAGSGTLTLSGSNIYTGSTSIVTGTLALGNNNVIPSGSAVTVNGGTLAVDGFSNTVGAITLQNGSISGTTGVLSSSSFDVRNGTISAVLGGSGTLTKSTSGTAVLSTSSNYSGGTNLNAGVLSVGSNNQLGATSGALNFNGGILQIAGTGFTSTSRSITWNTGGGGFDIVDETNSFTLSGTQNLGGSGQLTKQGQGTLVVSGTVGSSNVTIEGGILQTSAANRFVNSPTVSLLYDDAVLDFNGYNDTVGNLVLSGGIVQTGGATLTLQGNVTYNQSIWPAWITGLLNIDGSSHVFDVSHGSSTDLTILANISGTNGSINKTGDGILTLSGDNTYSGGTTVSAGTLLLDNSSALGSTLANMTVVSGALLNLNGYSVTLGSLSGQGTVSVPGGQITVGANNSSTIFSGTISGSGQLTKTGAGILTLSGGNTYTGTTTISGGTLQVGSGGAAGTLAQAR